MAGNFGNAGDTLVCDEHIGSEILSAWRDSLLSPAEMARIRTHAANCTACQARLAGFEAVAQALRQQREIEPDGRLLANLRVRAAQTSRRGHIHLPSRRTWRGLGALGSVAAVLLIAVYLLSSGPGRSTGPVAGKTPTAHATTTPAASPLAWRHISAPPGISNGQSEMDVSPADGNTVYACEGNSQAHEGSVAIWISRDHAAHWQPATSIPVRAATNNCYLHVDQLTPGTAVIAVGFTQLGLAPQWSAYTTYATTDYGQHWRALAFPQPTVIYQLATRSGTTYAILRGQPNDELAVSKDGMRTWQRIDSGIASGTPTASAFWLNPTTGSLLVWWSDLWASADGGTHWTRLQVPNGGPADPSANVVVRQPAAGEPWQLCVATTAPTVTSGLQPNKLTCSTDGGTTWTSRPGLNITFNAGTKGTIAALAEVFALTNDGAVLALEDDPSGATFYRLPAGSQQWQSLAPVPSDTATYTYVPTPGNGYIETFLPTMMYANYVP